MLIRNIAVSQFPQKSPAFALQVRNKWLRLLETMGGRGASMTGAPVQSTSSADSRSNNQQQQSSSQSGSGARGRGRGGFQNRGGNSRGGRGGSRVVPRPVIPPASANGVPCCFKYNSSKGCDRTKVDAVTCIDPTTKVKYAHYCDYYDQNAKAHCLLPHSRMNTQH
jgi:hypothetical protein